MPSADQWVIAIGIFLASVIISTFVNYLLRHATFLTKKTQTTVDDEVIRLLRRPVHFLFQGAGVVLAIWYVYPDITIRGYDYRDLAVLLITVLIAYTINRLIRGIVHWYENELEKQDITGSKGGVFGFLETLISVIIWGFAILFILHRFGVDVNALFAGLGIAGLALALGLQNTLSSVFSAVFLAVDKPIRGGDFVKLSSGEEGFVEDIGLRSTRIRTFSNNYVIVPNTKLADMVITNYYQPDLEVGIVVPIGVSYDADLEKVEKITVEVAQSILDEHDPIEGFEPFVRFNDFGDSAITFNVILRVKRFTDQYIVKHEFIKAIRKAYKKAGIEIPFPQIEVHTKK